MTYALRATPTRPPRCMSVEQHHYPDLGRCWLILWEPHGRHYRVERDGEWVDDCDGLHDARAIVRADARSLMED